MPWLLSPTNAIDDLKIGLYGEPEQPICTAALVKSQFSPISPNSQAASALLLLSFQSFADGPPIAHGVAERDATYRLETDDLVMFSDVRKV